ncbi:CHAT domain-containing tetratricopeptide repeat protein [Deinococcus humi]|uniref:Tetratricopeptide (TPR) repeat protein n=1 Tax=Deinococcus humi TaxID=662880 RepID=A0A7W8K1B1_9DEIO|nr:CHAT domain-containing tetratricopeptide repeat protein [Deinococcus humi]MBB5365763.1 tetratricopeptide (TPR) repeat protein [Deinococcus humi]
MSRLNAELTRIARLPADWQVQAYRNAHTSLLKKDPGNYPEHVQVLEALGRAEHAMKTPGTRLTVFALALGAQRRAMRGGVVFANILNHSTNVLKDLRRYDEALSIHEEALTIRRATLPNNDPLIADSLVLVANVLAVLRRYDEALEQYEKALTIRRTILSDKQPHIASILHNSANVLTDLRRYDEALARYEEALTIKRAALPHSHPDIADTLKCIAAVFRNLRRYDEALAFQEEALVIQRTAFPHGHPDPASHLMDSASVLAGLGRYDEALAKYKEVLTIKRAALPHNHPDIADILNNIGGVLRELCRYDEALECYEEALSIQRAALPQGHLFLAVSLHNSARILHELGRYDDAFARHEEALTIERANLPERHPFIAVSLENTALVLKDMRRYEDALAAATEALTIHLHNDQFPTVSKTYWGPGTTTQVSLPDTFAQTLTLCAQLPTSTVTALLTFKGNADIEQGLTSILQANATGTFRDRLDELQALQAEMARLQYSADAQDLLRVQEVTAQLETLERQIHTDPEGARLAEELQLRMITPPAVQSALQDDEALLNLFVSEDAVYAQILHQDGRHHLHRYAASDLEAQVAHLRQVLGDPGLLLHETPLLRPLQGLYASLIAPIAGLLGLGEDLKRLVISGDGFLYGLPWDLLCAPDASGARPLLAQVSTRLVPTPRDLLRLHRLESVPGSATSPAVLLGVQSFEEHGDSDQEGTETEAMNLPPDLRSAPVHFATRSAVMTTGGADSLPRYGNLNGTEQEIRMLTALLTERGRSVVSHLSPDASEQTLLNIGVAPWVLHFSTHSDVWDAEQTRPLYQRAERLDPRYDPAHPFSRAVVLLDGYTRRNFQGVLRAWELGSLNLRGTELVTFSSCNSGLGDMTAGRGVAGLSQAAFLAGAQRTITTLWPVLDATTPQWMGNVYTARLNGASWQDAVREEKLRMLAEEQPVSAWAPFVLNGLA